MAFEPLISADLHTNSSYLKVTDITGNYNAITNPTGWNDADSLLISDINTVTLTIVFPDLTEEEVDVTSLITSPTPGDYIIYNEEGVYLDGLYEFTYTILDDLDNSYTYTLRNLFLCNSRCCIDKMWALLPDLVGSKDYDIKSKDCLLAESLFNGLSCAGATLTTDVIENILARITRLCSVTDCGCN